MILRSEQIDLISKALVKAQAKIKHAVKDSVNPHFKSRYSDLASVMEAIREPFAENGLALLQPLSNDGDSVKCTTLILHESGQFIGSEMSMRPVRNDPQGMGSCATYLRRYMAAAAAAVASDDDDGNAASGKGTNNNGNQNQTPDTKATSLAAPPQSTVAKTESKPVGNVATSAQAVKWSKLNAGHRKKVGDFLKAKNYESLTDQLLNLLDGKICSQQVLNDTWTLINPEAPDRISEEL